MRRALKYIGIALAGLLALVAALVLGAWAAINTERGQAWLEARLAEALAADGAAAEVEGLSGPMPQRVALDRLVLRDAEGAWLTLEAAEVAWRPGALLSGRLEIARIHARRIHLARLPAGEPAPEEATTEPFSLPRPPVPIRLESLAVARLELDQPVLGEAATFRIDGQAAAPAAGALTSRLRVERLDGPGGALTTKATYTPDDRTLTLDADLTGAAGGLLAGALNLAPDAAVSASVRGSGPVDDWHGRAQAQLGPDASITADLGLVDARTATVEGRADVGALLPPDAARLMGGAADFAVSVSRHGESGAKVERARVATPTAALELSGTLDGEAGTLDVEGTLNIEDPAPFAAMVGASSLTEASATIRAAGPLDAPRLEATVRAERFAMPDMSADGAELTASFETDQSPTQGNLTARLTSHRVILAGPEFAGFSGAPLSAALDGRLDLDAMTLSAMTARLEGPDLTAELDGSVELDAGRGDTAFDVDIARLARLDPLLNLGLAGQGKLSGHLTFGAPDAMLRGTLAGDFRDVAWAEPILDTLAGGELALATDLSLAQDGAVTLSKLNLDAEAADISGEIGFPASFETMAGTFDIALPDAGVLSDALAVRLAGAATGTARLSGPTADPVVEANLDVRETSIEGTPLGRLQVQATARQLASGPNGSLRVKADATPMGAVQADTAFALTEESFDLSELTADGEGLKVAGGRLSAPLAGGALTGGADVRLTDLGAVGRRFDLPLSGSGRLSLSLGPGQSGQGATLNGDLEEVAFGPDAIARTVTLRADLSDVFADPRGTARVSVADAAAGPARLGSASLRLDGGLTGADLKLEAAGEAFGPLQLSADARVAQQNAATEITLTRLNAEVQGRSLSLGRPAVLRMEPDRLALRDLALEAEGGALRLDAERTSTRIDATAELDSLPLALTRLVLAEPQLKGVMDGRIAFSGPLARPEGDIQLTLSEVGLDGADLPPLDAWLNGRLADGKLSASGQMRGLSETPVQLSANLPLRVSLEPFAAELPPSAPIRGEVSWQGDVAPLMPFVPVSGHRLTGQGDVALRLEGSLADPRPRGYITLKDATYENLTSGTLLTELNARIEGDGTALRIVELAARDGGKGKLSATGRLDLAATDGSAVDLTLTAKKATLVRRDELTARTSADLTLSGGLNDLLLEGVVTVDRGEARLPENLPPEVATLDVVEKGGGRDSGGEAEDRKAEEETPSEPSRVGLDIGVDIPGRFFVRGQGLDTEWSGNLAVTGTADQPIVNGQLQAVRGQIDFLGKAFDLNRGVVAFDGGREIDPSIQAEAFHSGREIDVTVRVSGPATAPELELASTPELPQDEVISRLLFGKSATELSALEAGQLGIAVAQLTTGGSGGGVLDRLRGLVGADVLRVGSTEAGDPSVTAGKYIGQDVFVGVEQGTTTESSSAKVEVDLTDNIAVESRVGATGSSEVGIQFKWDY